MLVPAIHFPGTCAEAIALYQKALGAEVSGIAYYRDAPDGAFAASAPETADQIMHAELSIAGARINMCDVQGETQQGNMFLLNLFLDSADQVTAAFDALADGGEVLTPPCEQFFAAMYADLVDRFGVHWQLMAER